MMSQDFCLRLAIPSDAPRLADFNCRLAWETEAKRLNESTVLQGVGRVLEDSSEGFYTVIEVEGEVVAQALITYEWSDWRNGLVWWIQSVYVRPEFRGQGLFKALYAFVKDDCKARDECNWKFQREPKCQRIDIAP